MKASIQWLLFLASGMALLLSVYSRYDWSRAPAPAALVTTVATNKTTPSLDPPFLEVNKTPQAQYQYLLQNITRLPLSNLMIKAKKSNRYHVKFRSEYPAFLALLAWLQNSKVAITFSTLTLSQIKNTPHLLSVNLNLEIRK